MEKKKTAKQPNVEKPTKVEKEAAPKAPRSTGLTEKTEEELVDLTSRVYKLVVERGKDGVLQSEIWKELGLTRQGRLPAGDQAREEGDDQEGEGPGRRKMDLQAHSAASPGEHLVDGIRSVHRLPRGGQVLCDDRGEPFHLSADRSLGHEGAPGLAHDGLRRTGRIADFEARRGAEGLLPQAG